MGLAGFAHESVVSWWVSLAWLFLRGLTHLAIGWLLAGALGVTAWGVFHPLVGLPGLIHMVAEIQGQQVSSSMKSAFQSSAWITFGPVSLAGHVASPRTSVGRGRYYQEEVNKLGHYCN